MENTPRNHRQGIKVHSSLSLRFLQVLTGGDAVWAAEPPWPWALRCTRVNSGASLRGTLLYNTNKQALFLLCDTVCVCSAAQSCQLCSPWATARQALCPWDFPIKITRVGSHLLFQGIFPTQGSNPGLQHWKVDSLPSEPPGKRLYVIYYFYNLKNIKILKKITKT